MPELAVGSRIKTFEEVDLVLPQKNAREEAERCLDCCRICYNREKN
jgi:NADPH-dependent glutamate synthase beta subunit-like oxidoreductase